jgi:protein-L-isoaspartate(D-aspartate) O-methyltransferase
MLLTLSAAILLFASRCAAQDERTLDEARRRMVEEQLVRRDIEDPKVLAAMGRVPRHRFVPEALQFRAYADHPLPIGSGQTISQPYIVALMTQLAELEPDDTVLEIGTGSGYQAAVLAEIARQVYTIEIVPELAETAKARLAELGYRNVTARTGDGYAGWKEAAPFDAILVTAAPPEVPPPLVEQLAPGGILVIPVGPQSRTQRLLRIEKSADGSTTTREVIPVIFVPLVRER